MIRKRQTYMTASNFLCQGLSWSLQKEQQKVNALAQSAIVTSQSLTLHCTGSCDMLRPILSLLCAPTIWAIDSNCNPTRIPFLLDSPYMPTWLGAIIMRYSNSTQSIFYQRTVERHFAGQFCCWSTSWRVRSIWTKVPARGFWHEKSTLLTIPRIP